MEEKNVEIKKRNIRNRNRGKNHEKRTAKALGACRIGIMGGEDCWSTMYSIECKSVKKFVGIKWFAQCDMNNKDKKIPMVVVHQTGLQGDNDIIMLRRKDYLNILK